jgi:hypothetical protein
MASTTKHFEARMSQRGITIDMIELARMHGRAEGDRTILDRTELMPLLHEIRAQERTIMKLIDKGGVTVVEDQDRLITAYNVTSYDPRQARRNHAVRGRARRPIGYE